MSIATTFSPASLYWVYSTMGPTFEGSANGMQFRGGMISGPVSGFLAERLCARGFKALDYRTGDQFLRWDYDPVDGPGWFARFGSITASVESPSSTQAVDRPSFSRALPSPEDYDWPEELPVEWLSKFREYNNRGRLR